MTSPIPTPPPPAPVDNGATVVGGVGGPAGLTDAQLQDTLLTNVSPKDPPRAATLVYSPDVQILIAHGNRQYDVSADVVAFSVRRVENSVSSAVFRLANKDLRYNLIFEPMDRIIIRLKRVEWVQVFSGYLDDVPLVQIYPGIVNFRASCTLKRLLHTWWDPGLPASADIFDQASKNNQLEQAGAENLDQGLGSLLRNLLVKVGGWSSQDIHIASFPLGYLLYMQAELKRLKQGDDQAVHDFQRLLLGDDTSPGIGAAAGRQLGVTRGAYSLDPASRMLDVIRAVDQMAMGPDNRNFSEGEAIGVASQGGKDHKDQPAWQAHQELGKNWSEAALKNDAAVHCFMVIMAESHWVMYANNAIPESLSFPHEATSTNGSSIGLYQQQNFGEWGSVAQRMNAQESTGMFLQHLQKLDWRNMSRPAACQAVQRSKYADGSNYAAFEEAAIDAVLAIRFGTGTTVQGGQSGGASSLGGSLGASPLGIPATAGAPGAAGIPAIPTTNGTPSVTAAAGAIGQPQFNTASALSYARFQIGKPYVWGAKGPAAFDCSGLTGAAYRSMGLEIGADTYSQASYCQHIPATSLVPGDLIQPEPGHTVMWTGNGTIVEASTEGVPIHEVPVYFDVSSATCLHVPGTEYGGSPFAPFDPARATSGGGAAPGTVATGLGSGTAQTGSTEPIARNLFTYQFQAGMFANRLSGFYGNTPESAEKAFINDEPLIQTVVSFTKAGLRNFQSAPDGSFTAYYPDYFGLDGKGAVYHIQDIEMKNVQINLNDDALATHVYVAGSALPTGSGGGGILGWLNSKGVATVENEWLFQRLTALTPRVKGQFVTSGKEIMRKYGVRPLVTSMSSVMQGPMEFLLAVQIFMTKWAERYATQIETTFMPEVYPSMRVELVDHNLQVYVSEVTHSGDFENGFSTTMTIMAPSNPAMARLATQLIKATDQETKDKFDLTGNAQTVFGT